jgi:predicted DNA-binding transcriptional regulator AlpA
MAEIELKKEVDTDDLPEGLTKLGGETILFQVDLVRIFGRNDTTIWRAVERGELPPPIKLFGKNAWTPRSITRHLEKALSCAADERDRERDELKQRIAQLKP